MAEAVLTKKSDSKSSALTNTAKETNNASPENSSIQHIMELQQTIGNQAVQRMITDGNLQLQDDTIQPGDTYTREVGRLIQRVESSFPSREQRLPGSNDSHPQSSTHGPPIQSEVIQKVACDVEGNFTDIPGGDLKPEFFEPLRWYGKSFVMKAQFTPTEEARKTHGDQCDCRNGIYRQWVSGCFKINDAEIDHTLPFGKKLNKASLQLDGPPGELVYGDRELRDRANQYLPERATGCEYKGSDYPNIKIKEGEKGEIDLVFKGELIDKGRDQQLEESNWTIKGIYPDK